MRLFHAFHEIRYRKVSWKQFAANLFPMDRQEMTPSSPLGRGDGDITAEIGFIRHRKIVTSLNGPILPTI